MKIEENKDIENKGISVVISTYDDPINFVDKCLSTLLPQEKVSEIIVVDSSKKDEIKKLCSSIGNGKINYIHTPPKGMSDARNKGVVATKENIVAFTDADCIIDNNWAEYIYRSFQNGDDIAIVGGKIIPKWLSKTNNILCSSTIARGFYSLFDMGKELKEVTYIFGGNFAIKKSLMEVQPFSIELGRRKGNLLGGEETELCKQIKNKGLKIIYNPFAIVWHQISEERTKFEWMWNRIYYGGINRIIVGGMPTPKTVDTSYNIYDLIFLIVFIIPYTCGLLSGLKMYLKTSYRRYQENENGQ